ncbi:MAG: hypothetical protein H8D45_05620 [Bacteroidetes bacterium]|nr:hypothetical protein [Bacteroidota bacterium]
MPKVKPYKCNDCGTQDRGKFTLDNKSKCIKCIAKREKESRAKKKKKEKKIKGMTLEQIREWNDAHPFKISTPNNVSEFFGMEELRNDA